MTLLKILLIQRDLENVQLSVGREGLAYCSVLYPTQSHDLSANLPTVPMVAGKLSRTFFFFLAGRRAEVGGSRTDDVDT